MRPKPEVHDALARLLTYPGEEGAAQQYAEAVGVIIRACPQTEPGLRAFEQAIRDLGPGKLEELYARTFDNVADRSLEVGWQLFGEQYARGALMVRLREMMRAAGVPEATELPDHLTHVLALLARAPEKVATALATNQVMQAVEAVLKNLKSCDSHWVGVLEATRIVLCMHAQPNENATEVVS